MLQPNHGFRKRWLILLMGITPFVSMALGNVIPQPNGPWITIAEQKEAHIKIYARPMLGTSVREIRAETIVNSSLASLVALVEDTEAASRWMPHIRRMDLVQRMNEHHAEVYMVIHSPWPLQNRDVYLNTQGAQDPQTGVVTIRSHSQDGGLGLEKGCVRMPEMNTDWTFIPVAHQQVKVILRGFGLPGGIVPDWAVNLISRETPMGSLMHMQQEVTQPRYKDAHYADIKEVY